MLMRAFQNQSNALARWLSLLLVAFILYGTTVEAAHRHGRVLPNHQSASLVEPDQPNSPVNSKTGCSDCLICQLHQNFVTTLIAYRLVAPPVQLQIRVTTAVPPDVHFQLIGPIAGRAPPFIS
jgi:hypothetical protein